MAKQINISTVLRKTRRKRKGIHAKSKTSKLKQSKNYTKLYKSQGK